MHILRICLFALATLLVASPIVAADACPVAPIVLTSGVPVNIFDATRARANDFQDFCGDVSGVAPDVVYAFTLPADGSFKLGVLAIGASSEGSAGLFNPAVYIRTDCSVAESCFDFGDTSETVFGHFAAGTYHVIVDGSNSTPGRFILSAVYSEPECGDGVVNPGEQCDFSPPGPDDGCADPGAPGECGLETPGSDDACPGAVLVIGQGTTIVHGSNVAYEDNYTSPHAAEIGGRDRVYDVTPSVTGTMRVTVGLDADGVTQSCASSIVSPSCWDRMLYARTDCDDETFGAELGFSDLGATNVEQIEFSVTAGVPVSVIVDGYDDESYSSGVYDLKFELVE